MTTKQYAPRLVRRYAASYAEAVIPVPLLDLTAQYTPLRQQILDAITRVCDTQHFVMGPEVEGLEKDLAAMLEVNHALGVPMRYSSR